MLTQDIVATRRIIFEKHSIFQKQKNIAFIRAKKYEVVREQNYNLASLLRDAERAVEENVEGVEEIMILLKINFPLKKE